MAIGTFTGPGGHQSNINITPMIDVLLVLLILFLIIQPALTKGIDVQVPAVEAGAPGGPPPDQIILHVRAGAGGATYALNNLPVPTNSLERRLREVFADRPRKVVFVKGDESISYGDVIRALDVARASGIEVIGIVPRAPSETPPAP